MHIRSLVAVGTAGLLAVALLSRRGVSSVEIGDDDFTDAHGHQWLTSANADNYWRVDGRGRANGFGISALSRLPSESPAEQVQRGYADGWITP